ncbi:ATP-binding protein [Nocardia sp. BMG51109]|uniref:ATP-binding protein n=1 Tax=Nocardia sp. BMG51109 TaxID=1056816 RepID=UPI000463EA3C|nr:ATP-binding protein [Nocardia sp. BMG51109]
MLSGLGFHQIRTIPSPPPDGDRPADRQARHQRVAVFAALTAAHATLCLTGTECSLAVAWDRIGADGRIRVLVGGDPRFPSIAGRDADRMLFPPGATARAVPTESVVTQWERMPVWIRCTGRADSLWLPTPGSAAGRPRRGGFEDYITHLPGRFVWLVVASPVPPARVDEELAELEVQLPLWRAREDSEPARIAVQRGEFRYRELTRARACGVWNAHVLVGGDDLAGTHRAAGLLCSAADLDDLPYLLTPHPAAAGLAETLAAPVTGADTRSPFLADTELLAELARPPRRELPGIRMVEAAEFDLTPEHDGDIDLGTVLDSADAPVHRFTVTRDTLNRHGFVAGATGSGKSQTVRHLLEHLHTAGIPWLVIEPAKAEYAAMAGRTGAPVTVIRPGDPDSVPAGINPLEPEPGFPLQTHIDLIRALFLASFDAVEPFPQVLSHALTRCYTDLGWDTVVGAPRRPGRTPRYPTLGDLRSTALAVVDTIGYGREITDNVRGFIDVRLGSLRLGTPGRFFDGRYRLDTAALLATDTVIEIEDIGTDADKAFLIGAVLIRIAEHLRTHRTDRSAGLAHVTVLEEAHRLLRRAEPGSQSAHAVELFTALLAEIRAYGEGIVVAEQIPSKITPDVVKNTALKIVHRLPAAEDRDLVGATMNLGPAQSRHIVSLPPGRAVVFTDGMDRPVRIDIPLGETREARHPGPTPALFPAPRETPLALRDLHRAHSLADDPRLTLWTELTVIAHLVGRPGPRPDPDWLTTWIARIEPAILTEAVGHRLRTAVGHRYTGLVAYFPPEELIDHLDEVAAAALHCLPASCADDETRWQAGRYRWVDVEQALRDETLPADRPHPDTTAWAKRGLHLPGDTLAEQRDMLHAHPDNWADPRIVTGPEPGLLATTIDRLSRAPSIEQRLRHATAHLHGLMRWPLALLPAPELPAPDDTTRGGP